MRHSEAQTSETGAMPCVLRSLLCSAEPNPPPTPAVGVLLARAFAAASRARRDRERPRDEALARGPESGKRVWERRGPHETLVRVADDPTTACQPQVCLIARRERESCTIHTGTCIQRTEEEGI
jgi:hypothetical protein